MVKEDAPKPIKEEDLIDEGAAVIGTMCWIREGDSRECGPYMLCEIVAKEGPDVYQIKSSSDAKGKTYKKSLTEMLGANEVRPSNMADLTKLMYIHEAAVSDLLRARYKQALIFTNVGAMLLVVNPFKDLGLVGTDRVLAYRRMPKKDIMGEQKDPHTFALCAKSVHIFNEPGNDMNISFVISGESGAGKTESTKHNRSFFTTPPDGSNVKDKISEAIMAGNPVLEAFGNATTVRNNNSSRFGRLIKMYIKIENYKDPAANNLEYPVPKLYGADVTPFLLEKSRITHQASEKERNYHVFYQILKGMKEEKFAEYKLSKSDWHKMKYVEAGLMDVPGRPKKP